jgi:hypothetical protein
MHRTVMQQQNINPGEVFIEIYEGPKPQQPPKKVKSDKKQKD